MPLAQRSVQMTRKATIKREKRLRQHVLGPSKAAQERRAALLAVLDQIVIPKPAPRGWR